MSIIPILTDHVLDVDWGIDGQGTYNPATDTLSVSSHDGGSIAANALVNYAVVDANGNIYRILANTATTSPGGPFNITIAPVAGQPEPVSGAFTVMTPATDFVVSLEQFNDDFTTLSGRRQWFNVAKTPTGVPRTEWRSPVLPPGTKWRVIIVAKNAALTPGVVESPPVDVVIERTTQQFNMPPITALAKAGVAVFSWTHPTGFLSTPDLLYQLVVTKDGSTPTFPVIFIDMGTETFLTRENTIRVIAEPGTLVRVVGRIVNSAGRALGTSSEAQVVVPAEVTMRLPVPIKDSFLLTDTDFVLDPVTGVRFARVDRQEFSFRVAVNSILFEVISLVGTGSPIIKPRVQSAANHSIAEVGPEVSTTGVTYFEPTARQMLGDVVEIGVEKVQGTITDLQAILTVAYLYESAEQEFVLRPAL
jgi:hypothetical protein